MTLTDEQADRLGRIADSLDAGLFGAKLPLPPGLHMEGLTGIMRSARDEVAALVREITGDDPWATNPLEG